MVKNPPAGTQRVIPYLAYADAPAAIDFLCRAFGFEERFRVPMPDGRVAHTRRKKSARSRTGVSATPSWASRTMC